MSHHSKASIEPFLGVEEEQAAQVRRCAGSTVAKHNCWHNCELTEALQCLAPEYGDEAHRKVAERMKQDMGKVIVTVDRCEEDDIGQTRMIVNTNCDYHRESDEWNALASTLEAAPDLLAALEGLYKAVLTEPYAGKPKDMAAAFVAARAAIAKARGLVCENGNTLNAFVKAQKK